MDGEAYRDKLLFSCLLVVVGVGESLTLTGVLVYFSKAASGKNFGVYNLSAGSGLLVGTFAFGDYDRRGGWPTVNVVLGILAGMAGALAYTFIERSQRLDIGKALPGVKGSFGCIADAGRNLKQLTMRSRKIRPSR